MKKCLVYIAVLSAILACGNKTPENTSGTDSTAAKDTAGTAKASMQEEKEEGPVCHDRELYNLKGDVKRVDSYNTDFPESPFQSVVFDEQGRLKIYKIEVFEGQDHVTYTYPDEKSLAGKVAKAKDGNSFIDCKMVRDAEGRLTEFVQNDFEYDAAGRVRKWGSCGWESYTKYTYTAYNDNGEPTRATFDGSGEGMDWKGSVTYKYTKRDAQGNWTQCVRSFHYTEFGDSEDPSENDGTTTINRKIVYNNQ